MPTSASIRLRTRRLSSIFFFSKLATSFKLCKVASIQGAPWVQHFLIEKALWVPIPISPFHFFLYSPFSFHFLSFYVAERYNPRHESEQRSLRVGGSSATFTPRARVCPEGHRWHLRATWASRSRLPGRTGVPCPANSVPRLTRRLGTGRMLDPPFLEGWYGSGGRRKGRMNLERGRWRCVFQLAGIRRVPVFRAMRTSFPSSGCWL